MKKILSLTAACLIGFSGAAITQENSLSFFITSTGSGNGADLGGLAGADAHCTVLAEAAGVTGKTWSAYLSTQARAGVPAVNARDRIGRGPWFNANGVQVAVDLDQLHSANNLLSKENSLTESGEVVSGRGDTPNQHDILTGSDENGFAFADEADKTCDNWTSSSEGSAQAGHHDRVGGGDNGESWSSAHGTRGCSLENLQSSGGNGYFYCFAHE